jgi:hypothetical protein
MASVALASPQDPFYNLQARPTVYKSGTLAQSSGPWVVASAGVAVLDLAGSQFPRNCEQIIIALLYSC